MEELTAQTICQYIDHTDVRPEATTGDIKNLCEQAKKYHFHSVCVSPFRVKNAREFLGQEKTIELICVVGFPYGFVKIDEKVAEAKTAIDDGATEIDMVANIGAIKDGNWQLIKEEIRQIAEAISPNKLKVILEVGFLTKDELMQACKITKDAGAAFVKTSTGFGPRDAKVEDIEIMRQVVGPNFGVKASGGIHDFKTASEMIKAGANRIGTSHSLEIIGAKELSESKTLSKE